VAEELSRELNNRLRRFLVSAQNLYRDNYRGFAEAFLHAYAEVYRWPLGTTRIQPIEKPVVSELVEIIKLLRGIQYNTLDRARESLEEVAKKKARIYIVDCLGLPEAYSIWQRSAEKKLTVAVKAFINLRATTEAFKRALSRDPGGGELTMAGIARQFGGQVLTELDRRLHSAPEQMDSAGLVDWIVSTMGYAQEYILGGLGIPAGGALAIAADHGYDIVLEGNKYSVKHTSIPRGKAALARLSTIVVLERPSS